MQITIFSDPIYGIGKSPSLPMKQANKAGATGQQRVHASEVCRHARDDVTGDLSKVGRFGVLRYRFPHRWCVSCALRR